MADPILHIKDSYYFEVPKALWRYDYNSWGDATAAHQFLGQYQDRVSLSELNHELSGKIIYPQPLGTIANLYEPASGFCISKFMLIEVVVAVVLVAVFWRVAKRVGTGAAPTGGWWNLFEAMVVFIREQVAKPAIGEHDVDEFVPLLWTLFFFILGCNLCGILPWMGTPTSAWAVTAALAVMTFGAVVIGGVKHLGPMGFLKNQIPRMDLPLLLSPLKAAIWIVEVVGLLIKHTVLSVRLLANMLAGHLVLLAILGLIVAAQNLPQAQFGGIAFAAVTGSAVLTLLELFVALLQAYIFTFLSALFIGAAVHHH
ncbi:MAG: F0F1 ATP synthase subunit A [Planctomycetia bacterium]|nr:F0F1 ATP synthase subunit A [Planctomycetia bacterium]